MEMWSSFNDEVIQDTIHKAMVDDSKITLWQTKSDQSRDRFYGKLVETSKTEVKIELTGKEGHNPISATESIFIHCESNGLIFKRENFKLVNGIISFPYPHEVKLEEKRKIPRFLYKYQDYKVIAFHQKVMNIHGVEEEVKFSGTLTDISTEGLSFVVEEEELGALSIGSEVYVTKLTDQELPKEHHAKLVYLQSYVPSRSESRTRFTKVGMKFIDSLESVSFKSISSLVDKKQKRVKGLEVETFNGLHPDDQERVIKKIKSDNPALASNIIDQNEQLDRLRFLTTKMKQDFLLEVNLDLLAGALRLSSKELIFELFNEVSDAVKEEFLHNLANPKAPSAINKAQDKIVAFMLDLEKKGVIVLDSKSYSTLV